MNNMKIAIFIYQGITMLDAIGPYEVLRNLKEVEIMFVAEHKKPILADSTFLEINPKYSIDEVKKVDILLIPGSTVGYLRIMKNKKVLKWIQEIHSQTIKTVSVCSGSIILGAAGLLAGKKATSHWGVVDFLTNFQAIPTRERFVEEGKIITAAGVSAGIDMAIYLVNSLEGALAAKSAQLAIEYDPNPMFQSGNFLTADKEVIKLAEQKLETAAKKELSFWDIISNARTLLKMR